MKLNKTVVFGFCFYSILLIAVIFCPVRANAKILRAFIGGMPPSSLDPNDSSDGITSDHLNQVFETLLWIDYDGKLQPALCADWQRIDANTLLLNLRKGVKFHNGENFDSAAVKFSLDRFINPDNHASGRFYGSTISKVEVVDKYIVRIKTSVPDSLLQYRLAIIGSMKHHKNILRVADLNANQS